MLARLRYMCFVCVLLKYPKLNTLVELKIDFRKKKTGKTPSFPPSHNTSQKYEIFDVKFKLGKVLLAKYVHVIHFESL